MIINKPLTLLTEPEINGVMKWFVSTGGGEEVVVANGY